MFVDVGSLFSVTRPVLQSSEGVRELDLETSEPLFTQVTFNDAGERVSVPTLAPINSITGEANAPRFLPETGFQEFFLGDTAKPRVTAGVGVNWNSPFGPFRIDFAQTILSEPGDDTKRFTFNVGTQF